jgi:acetoacetyl-CoA reductase
MSEGNGNGKTPSALKGRVALVTGAARGIGRAIALELARCGASVAVNCRAGVEEAESLVGEIGFMSVPALLVRGDVAEQEEACRVVQAVVDAWGRLDVLVNIAGITRDRSHRKVADDEWADVINVNVNGTYHCTRAALPHMVRQRFGRIINVSCPGQTVNFGQANAGAGKDGILSFTKTVALEMAKYNITANTIAPGFTCTEMVDTIPMEVLDQIKARIPMQRFGRPDEIARAAAFLAADADYMTGQQFSINGGMYLL